MATIALLTPTPPDVSALGVRSISAFLKQQGHFVKTFLLPGGVEETRYSKGHVYRYPEPILAALVSALKDIDIVGISFMTNYFDRAIQLSERIRKELDCPVVFGGVHPTVKPEEAIEYVDYVCVGEGELAFSQFIENMEAGKSILHTPNFWIRHKGTIIKNKQMPLIEDLDILPFVDYSFDDQFSVDLQTYSLIPQNEEFLRMAFPVRPNLDGGFDSGYIIMTERGCPFSCTYCINNQMREMAGKQKFLRRRSIEHVLAELKEILARLPFLKTVIFFDDTLAARPLHELEEFAERFPKEIGLSFHGQVSPTTITPEKWELLLQAGMIFVEMGIQTGNERIRQMYNRTSTNEQVARAASLIHSSKDRILAPCYHVILDNPWEKELELLETLDVILKLPKPFWLKRASLVLYPGTKLYEKALSEEMITNEKDEIYRKHLHTPHGNYLNCLFYLSDWMSIPRFVIRFLANPRIVARFNHRGDHLFYQNMMRLLEFTTLLGKGFQAIFRGDVARIFRYVKRVK